MMNDLDTLRPEVADAVRGLDRDAYLAAKSSQEWRLCRAELLRLNRENAELRRAWGDTLLTGTGILKVERIDPATVRLPVEPQQEPTK